MTREEELRLAELRTKPIVDHMADEREEHRLLSARVVKNSLTGEPNYQNKVSSASEKVRATKIAAINKDATGVTIVPEGKGAASFHVDGEVTAVVGDYYVVGADGVPVFKSWGIRNPV